MKSIRRLLIAVALVVALAGLTAASAAPTFYCGYNLDRICRIICPKCLSAPARPVGTTRLAR